MRSKTAAFLALVFCLFLTPPAAKAQDFFWESPFRISGRQAAFPQTAAAKDFLLLAWQESEGAGTEAGKAYISLAIGKKAPNGSLDWERLPRVVGPIAFSGTEPPLYSLCLGKSGEILLAYPSSLNSIALRVSRDRGRSFNSVELASANAISPRLYTRSDGGYLLFATLSQEAGAFSLVYARSEDGLEWTSLAPFLENDSLKISFLPSSSGLDGRELVVFQSLVTAERSSFQLFRKSSLDGGRSWSAAQLLTDFQDPGAKPADVFDNQNPSLSRRAQGHVLVWERGLVGRTTQIYYGELSPDGRFLRAAEKLTTGAASSSSPYFFEYRGKPGMAWSDNQSAVDKGSIVLKEGDSWLPLDLSIYQSDSFYMRPVSFSDSLHIFWQSARSGQPGIYALLPDRSVPAPSLRPLNFKAAFGVNQNGANIGWTQAQDSSGIEGYSFSWSQSPSTIPAQDISIFSGVSSSIHFADADGPWYFALRAKDYAGNWSETARIEFRRDTKPPESPRIESPTLDANGYLSSNSFRLEWQAPSDPEIAGYSYALSPYTGPEEFIPPLAPSYPLRVLGKETRSSFGNIDNGSWLFQVAAIDQAGNISNPASILLKTNKFIPYTLVSSVLPKQDRLGNLSLQIFGRGFSEEGETTRLIVDLDGKSPYDREFDLAAKGFSLRNDRLIELPLIEGLDADRYRIGIVHPKRGLYFSPPILSLAAGGTVKFGDYQSEFRPSWQKLAPATQALPLYHLATAALFILCAAFVLMLSFRLYSVVEDNRVISLEIQALIQGVAMPSRIREKRIGALIQRRSGLRLKFSLFVIALVILIVASVSLPLMINSVRTQSGQLAKALYQRTEVLLESLVSGSEANLAASPVNIAGLLGVTEQRLAMAEAKYVTITGYKRGSIVPEAIWASNDPDIVRKTDNGRTPEYGDSLIKDELSPRMEELLAAIESDLAGDRYQSIKQVLEKTVEDYRRAIISRNDNLAKQLENDQNAYGQSLNTELARIRNQKLGSVPEFDFSGLDRRKTSYLFYKPVLRYNLGSEQVFLGMVRLEVSTESIQAAIDSARDDLIRLTLIIALLSIAVGILGALFLSAIIIRPIKRLVKGIEIIRDTVNKEDLASHRIDLRTRDELSTLSEAINQMTKGLVRGAKDNADLLAGEQDQRELLPLESDPKRKKLSIGKLDTPNIEFYGYYKGAKLVSGDYLDFRSLDGRYYAFIKCDVSGKGVSAAMIMAIVASVFRRWFDGWKPSKPGFKLEDLCYQINETLNVCEFKGKFATLMVGIIDSTDGKTYLAHAGDKFYRIYETGSAALKTYELAGTAPAGPFTEDMIKMQSPFRTAVHTISKGDIMVLYTDGIDEARRYQRGADYGKIPRPVNEAEKARRPAGHSDQGDTDKEYQFEDFNNERAAEIVEAIVAKRSYRLLKDRDPSNDELEFDFSNCSGQLEDIVLGLVAVEKVFRMYRKTDATAEDQVKIDIRLDSFLKEHFKQYFLYCANRIENPEEKIQGEDSSFNKEGMPSGEGPKASPHYILYTKLFEDEQYDDITVLALRKK